MASRTDKYSNESYKTNPEKATTSTPTQTEKAAQSTITTEPYDKFRINARDDKTPDSDSHSSDDSGGETNKLRTEYRHPTSPEPEKALTYAEITHNTGLGGQSSTTLKDSTTGAQVAFAGISAEELIAYNNEKAAKEGASEIAKEQTNYNYLLQGFADTYNKGLDAPIVKVGSDDATVNTPVKFTFQTPTPEPEPTPAPTREPYELFQLTPREGTTSTPEPEPTYIIGNVVDGEEVKFTFDDSSLAGGAAGNQDETAKKYGTSNVDSLAGGAASNPTIDVNKTYSRNGADIGTILNNAGVAVDTAINWHKDLYKTDDQLSWGLGIVIDFLLPANLIETVKKITDGKANTIRPEDILLSAIDVAAFIPFFAPIKAVKVAATAATVAGTISVPLLFPDNETDDNGNTDSGGDGDGNGNGNGNGSGDSGGSGNGNPNQEKQPQIVYLTNPTAQEQTDNSGLIDIIGNLLNVINSGIPEPQEQTDNSGLIDIIGNLLNVIGSGTSAPVGGGGGVTVVNQPAESSGSGFDISSITPYVIPLALIAGGVYIASKVFGGKKSGKGATA